LLGLKYGVLLFLRDVPSVFSSVFITFVVTTMRVTLFALLIIL
jgi:hypothetical protein